MFSISVSSLICIFVSVLPVSSKENSELLFVQIFFRHGDRAPVFLYPNDPNPESFWKEGLGMLTTLGRKQPYELGKFLKHMYGNFITSNPNEINVISSASDRCMLSAQLLLASFFAPSSQWQLEEGLNWQPIPIRYLPTKEDKFLTIDSYCPRATEEQDRVFNSPESRASLAKYKEMFQNLTTNSSTPVTDWLTAGYLTDTLLIEKKYNLSIPVWATLHWEELEQLIDNTFFWILNSPVSRRLRAGPILGKIIELMKMKIAGNIPSKKIQIYSSHDAIMAAILQALNLFNMKRPPVCATLLFELHRMADSRMAVRILYLNSSTPETGTQTPHVLTLEGCSEFCPLDHFVNSTKGLIPEDWERECQLNNSFVEELKKQNLWLVLLLAIPWIVFTVIIVLTAWKFKTSDVRKEEKRKDTEKKDNLTISYSSSKM